MSREEAMRIVNRSIFRAAEDRQYRHWSIVSDESNIKAYADGDLIWDIQITE